MVVAVFQAGWCRDPFIQACAREIWLICDVNDITPRVVHTLGDQLTDTVACFAQSHRLEHVHTATQVLSHTSHIASSAVLAGGQPWAAGTSHERVLDF